jgi:hypothetical protein
MYDVRSSRMMRRLQFLLVLAVLAAASLRVASVWERLPLVTSSHFGVPGKPDGFMPREAFFQLMAAVGGGTSLLMVPLSLLLKFVPSSLVSIPHREHWPAPGRRDASIARPGAYLAWFGVALALFMAGVLELVLRANLHRSRLENGPFIALLACFGVALIGLIIVAQRSFRVTPRG